MVWLRKLLFDVGISIATPTRLYCDNVSATYMTANPVLHDRSKNIVVHYHFVCEQVAHGDLIVCYIPTGFHIVDIFTKGLSSQQFLCLKSKLSVCFPEQLKGA